MYDDRYGYPGLFDIGRCTRCGHLHIRADFTAQELSKLYTQYYPRARFTIEQYRVPDESRGVAAWLSGERCAAFRWVPKAVRVLDIGCGFCETLGYHQSRGCEAYGVEADANVELVAAHFGFNVHIGLFDPDRYQAASFDYVTLDQVIEHVADPHKVMAGVARVLKPGGTAVISTPNARGWGVRLFGRRWINWHIPYHLQQFTRRSLTILARDAGLELSHWRTLTHSDWMFFQAVHLIVRPKPGERHPFWSGQKWETEQQDRRYRAAARLRTLRVFQIASRVLDAIGLGDNQLCMLRKPMAAS